MPDNPILSSRVLDLGSLFAAPLVSVIEADVLAAQEFTRFLKEFGFIDDSGSGTDQHLGKLKTVTFTYKRPNPNGTLDDAVVEIPLLSLVPLPLLQVTEADFQFNVRILETETGGPTAPPPLLNAAQANQEQAPAEQRPRVRAMLAQAPAPAADGDSGQRRNELDANMAVKLSMKQADVPAGISALLNLMSQSINSTTTPTPEPPHET